MNARTLAWWFIACAIGNALALTGFLIWWPLLVYSWNYWTGGAGG